MIIVDVCTAFGLTVSKKSTTCLTLTRLHRSCDSKATGQKYAHTKKFVYLGGTFSGHAEHMVDIKRSVHLARNCIKYIQRGALRTFEGVNRNQNYFKTEVLETMLCGCVTWSTNGIHYTTLRTQHRRVLLRCVGLGPKKGSYGMLGHEDALINTKCNTKCNSKCEYLEMSMRRHLPPVRRILVRIDDSLLSKHKICNGRTACGWDEGRAAEIED